MHFKHHKFYKNFNPRPIIKHKGGDVIGDVYIDGNLNIGKNLTSNSFYARGNFYLNNNILLPAGSIIMSACHTEPDGWLDCDGRILNIKEYQDLFDSIGFSFSNGNFDITDNSFNIPDFKGRVGLGLSQNYNIGMSGGEESHTLTINEMPSHSHNATIGDNGSHNHSINNIVQITGSNTPGTLDNTADEIDTKNLNTGTTTTSGIHSHSINIEQSGLSEPHNNMQPYLSVRYLIKY